LQGKFSVLNILIVLEDFYFAVMFLHIVPYSTFLCYCENVLCSNTPVTVNVQKQLSVI